MKQNTEFIGFLTSPKMVKEIRTVVQADDRNVSQIMRESVKLWLDLRSTSMRRTIGNSAE